MGTVLGEGGRKKLIALAHICPDPEDGANYYRLLHG
jgi:hypothetical protein